MRTAIAVKLWRKDMYASYGVRQGWERILRVSCQKGPICHAFWQDTLDMDVMLWRNDIYMPAAGLDWDENGYRGKTMAWGYVCELRG